jgi:hypothetical protein
MKQFSSQVMFFKNTNNWNKLVISIAFFSFSIRIYVAYVFPEFFYDEIIQLVSALQLLSGNGLSIPLVHQDDLSILIHQPFDKFPPGYALLALPLLKLGLKPLMICFWMDVLGYFIFYLSWILIFFDLKKKIDPIVPIIFFLFIGVAYSPFRFLNSTDNLSLGFSFLAIFLIVRLSINYINLKSLTFLSLLTFSVVCFLPSFFRFAYLPISLILTLIFAGFTWITYKKNLFISVFPFVFTFVLLFAMQLFLYYLKHQFIYLYTHHPVSDKLFFFENLREFNPIFINAFFPELLIRVNLGVSIMNYLNLIGSLIIAFILFYTIKSIFLKILGNSNFRISSIFIFYFSLISIGLVTVLFLTALSMIFAPLQWGNRAWTYVSESRYYAVLFIGIIFIFIMAAFETRIQTKRAVRVVAQGVLISSFLFSLVLLSYYLKNYSLTDGAFNMREYYKWSHDLPTFFKKEQLHKSSLPVVYFSDATDSPQALLFALEGAVPLDINQVKGDTLHASSPVRVLFVYKIEKEEPADNKIKIFSKKHQAKLLAEIKDINTEIWEAIILTKQTGG